MNPGLTVTGTTATIDGNVSLGQSGVEDSRTYIQVADGAVLHFSGVVKGNVTQVGGTGFNGTIQFDGLRKSGFSPGFSSYLTRDFTTGQSTLSMWGTQPSTASTPAASPYYSVEQASTAILPASGSSAIQLQFDNDSGVVQYVPQVGDTFRFIRTSTGGTIDNTNGMDESSLSFRGANVANLHILPLLTVVEGVDGYVELKFIERYLWLNAADTTVFQNPGNWPTNLAGTPVTPGQTATTATPNVAIFNDQVVNYSNGAVKLSAVRTLGGLSFADSGQGGYTLSSDTATVRVLTLNNASGATITVLSGVHKLATTVTVSLASNLSVAVNDAAGSLTIAGAMTQSGTRSVAKTGAGTFYLDGAATYTGGTTVTGGTLAGIGSTTGAVGVSAGGAVKGGNVASPFGTLTLGNTTIAANGILGATLGIAGTSGKLAMNANFLSLATGTILKLAAGTGFAGVPSSYTLATLTSGSTLQLDGNAAGVADGFVYGTFTQGGSSSGPVTIDASALSLAPTTQATLSRTGNALVLSFTTGAVPEPGLLLLLAAGVLGVARRRKA